MDRYFISSYPLNPIFQSRKNQRRRLKQNQKSSKFMRIVPSGSSSILKWCYISEVIEDQGNQISFQMYSVSAFTKIKVNLRFIPVLTITYLSPACLFGWPLALKIQNFEFLFTTTASSITTFLQQVEKFYSITHKRLLTIFILLSEKISLFFDSFFNSNFCYEQFEWFLFDTRWLLIF